MDNARHTHPDYRLVKFPPVTRCVQFLIVVSLALALNAAYWQWQGRAVELPDVPGGRIDCLSYTPYDADNDPRNPMSHVPPALIEQQLSALSDITRCVRLYSSRGSADDVLAAARHQGMRVILGIWVAGDPEVTRLESEAAFQLLNKYQEVVSLLVVGNEVLLRGEMNAAQLIEVITAVRARSAVPIAYAEVSEYWQKNASVAPAVDVMLVHLLPYWADPAPSVEEAQILLDHDLTEFLHTFPDRKIMIGETGWPSAGPSRAAAAASVVNEARYVREFVVRAKSLGVPYNLIEALDQSWKRQDEGTAGGYWGILDVNGKAKFPLTGPVSEWPQWCTMLLVAGFLGVLFSIPLLLNGVSWWRAVLVAPLAQALGSYFVIALHYATDISYNWQQTLFASAACVVAFISSIVVLDVMARGRASCFSVAPASLAELFHWCRHRQDKLSASLMIALLQFFAAFPAAVLSIALALDARHRDIPALLFLPSVLLALATLCLPTSAAQLPRRAELLLASVLLTTAGFTLDSSNNHEAIAWCAVAVLLALPWLRYVWESLLSCVRRTTG